LWWLGTPFFLTKWQTVCFGGFWVFWRGFFVGFTSFLPSKRLSFLPPPVGRQFKPVLTMWVSFAVVAPQSFFPPQTLPLAYSPFSSSPRFLFPPFFCFSFQLADRSFVFPTFVWLFVPPTLFFGNTSFPPLSELRAVGLRNRFVLRLTLELSSPSLTGMVLLPRRLYSSPPSSTLAP